MLEKMCTKCKETRPVTAFSKHRTRKDGLQAHCRACVKAYNKAHYKVNTDKVRASAKAYREANLDKVTASVKAWKKANPDKVRAINKAWKKANPDKVLATNKVWYEANPDKMLAYQKTWKKANPDKCNAINAKRHASKLQATPNWLTDEHLAEIQEWYTTAQDIQWLSLEPLHVDHIIPLQGKNVCGLHVPWNLQILPKSENIKKGNKLLKKYTRKSI